MDILIILAALWLRPSELGSPDWRTRDAATARLYAAGPLAGPLLNRCLRSPDPEVRQRAAALRGSWDRDLLSRTAQLLLTAEPDRPTSESIKLWLVDPRRLLAIEAAAVRLKVYDPATEAPPWGPGYRGGRINPELICGFIHVMRARVAGMPLPFPYDPRGPRPMPQWRKDMTTKNEVPAVRTAMDLGDGKSVLNSIDDIHSKILFRFHGLSCTEMVVVKRNERGTPVAHLLAWCVGDLSKLFFPVRAVPDALTPPAELRYIPSPMFTAPFRPDEPGSEEHARSLVHRAADRYWFPDGENRRQWDTPLPPGIPPGFVSPDGGKSREPKPEPQCSGSG